MGTQKRCGEVRFYLEYTVNCSFVGAGQGAARQMPGSREWDRICERYEPKREIWPAPSMAGRLALFAYLEQLIKCDCAWAIREQRAMSSVGSVLPSICRITSVRRRARSFQAAWQIDGPKNLAYSVTRSRCEESKTLAIQ